MGLLGPLARTVVEQFTSFNSALLFFIILIPAYHLIFLPIYNSLCSRLSALPGPKLTLLTPHYVTILDALLLRTNTIYLWHQKYGPIVRLGPNEVSFTSPTAIKQIYQDPTMEKDTRLYGLFTHFGASNAFTSTTRAEHGWRRKGVAGEFSWSRVLDKELAQRLVGKVIRRYLNFIENSEDTTGADEAVKGKLVDIYLLNNWFATDIVTGFIFGQDRGTRTLCFDREAGEQKTEWWQTTNYHRRMVKEHYASSLRTHTYLYVEFPLLMSVVDWVLVKSEKAISHIMGYGGNTAALEKEVIGRRIVDWGWKTWMSVRGPRKAGNRIGECVADSLARLVEEATGESTGDEKKLTPGKAVQWANEIAASELMDQMLAGMDTTSDTLTFLVYHLSLPSSHHIQARLHDELITNFLPGSSKVPHFFIHQGQTLGTVPNVDYLQALTDINGLPYLNGVIKEALRIYSAIPGTLPRVIPSCSGGGKVIDGIFIPSGTIVGTFAYGIHRDQSIFGSVRFSPERWIIPEESKASSMNNGESHSGEDDEWVGVQAPDEDTTSHEGHERGVQEADDVRRVRNMEQRLWAFGSGGRGCVGRHLAMLEMKMLVATLYWRYKTDVVGNADATRFGKLHHSHWDRRKTFRDVLPFKGVNGLVRFSVYNDH